MPRQTKSTGLSSIVDEPGSIDAIWTIARTLLARHGFGAGSSSLMALIPSCSKANGGSYISIDAITGATNMRSRMGHVSLGTQGMELFFSNLS